MKKLVKVSGQIRESIDYSNIGICFCMENGRPILSNKKINSLSLKLTDHTILDGREFWDELVNFKNKKGFQKLKRKSQENEQIFKFPDNRIWQFVREYNRSGDDNYIQIVSSDITDLYKKRAELIEQNRSLSALAKRQKELLSKIVETNRDKELLSIKMQVHANFGKCLIGTKKMLSDDTIEENSEAILKSWKSAVHELYCMTEPDDDEDFNMEDELYEVAQIIGCKIEFIGEKPKDRENRYLMCAVIREALTNAVRHANATHLSVLCEKSSFGYHIEVTDNGEFKDKKIVEGGGLSSLRKKLEGEGAYLSIECRDNVKIIADLPVISKK